MNYNTYYRCCFLYPDLLCFAPEHQKSPLTCTSKAGDVYSFGIVVFELFTRTEPYSIDLKKESITGMYKLDDFSNSISQASGTTFCP